MKNFWGGSANFMFPLLMLIGFIMMITCAQVGIVVTFVNLIYGNYKWWWQSFFSTASCGLYVLAYSTIFFFIVVGPKNLNHF